MHAWMDAWMDAWMHVWIDAGMKRCMDGWMHKWRDAWMDTARNVKHEHCARVQQRMQLRRVASKQPVMRNTEVRVGIEGWNVEFAFQNKELQT